MAAKTPAEPHQVNGLSLATGLFTLLPSRPVTTIDRDAARRAILWFPWLGLGLGLVAGTIAALVTYRTNALLGAALGLILVEIVTGFMHLDGIADTADGLGARGKPANDALAIMKKSDIGPMGVAAIVTIMMLQIVGLAASDSPLATGMICALSPMVGRATTILATGSWVPNARPGGFGSLFCGVCTPRDASITMVMTVLLCGSAGWWLHGWLGALALGLSAAFALVGASLWQRSLVRVFGGLTGDMMGALIEASSTIFIVCAAIFL